MSYPQAVETKNNSPQAQKPQETMPPPEAYGSLGPPLSQVPPKGYHHHCGPHGQERPGEVIEAGDLSVPGNVLMHDSFVVQKVFFD